MTGWRIAALLALLGSLMFARPAFAVLPSEMLPDPAQEARARTISEELRCMVCQNQSIDDSDADLAHDLRVLVRERIKAGDSDSQVIDYIVARYGEFVLLKPTFSLKNALLWGTPGILLAAGAIFVVFTARSRRRSEPRLSADEQAALDRILAGTEEELGGGV
ncbi:cytochrome c-type biogenesis protein [Mesorhizobium sp. BAC0120]|uniref:cytochrome c-type biogenesis protein n=1 Tax=Mesorhizobium sp. BAC0120 TaxID=3090670 RepID=UPI00298CE6AE|nr:cytochrome c-type biogenesis protein [Mesorhizobium sp. BAC0120]MDW6021123.1 cytochrome c-type biogenesis protein [Mesorhizobium sp. BAC0120]